MLSHQKALSIKMSDGISQKLENLSPTHQKWLGEYLENLARRECSELTLKSYQSDLIHFLSWFELTAARHIDQARAFHIAAYQQFLKVGGVAQAFQWSLFCTILSIFRFKGIFRSKITFLELRTPLAVSSRKRRLTSLKKFFDYLGETERMNGGKRFKKHPISPSLHHIKLKDADIEHSKLLPREKFESLCENLTYPEDRLLFRLLFDGGLRIREASRLTYEDFNEQNQNLSLIRKGGKRHTFALQNSTEIFRELARVRQRNYRQSDFIFPSSNGNKPVNVRTLHERVKKHLKSAHLPTNLSPHSFRKGCATDLYQKTRDLLHVRDYLNHQNALVTQTYIENSSGLAKIEES